MSEKTANIVKMSNKYENFYAYNARYLHQITCLIFEFSNFLIIDCSVKNCYLCFMARPRKFDEDRVLDATLDLFWRRGFRNTSMNDILQATGLQKGSLYGAFADKRSLFLRILDRYAERQAQNANEFFTDAERTPLTKLREFLYQIARDSTGYDAERGCLITKTTLEVFAQDAEIGGKLQLNFQLMTNQVAEILASAQKSGEIRADVDVQTAARAVVTLIQGFRVIGKIVHTPESAKNTVDLFISGLT
jgi:TetR/AcrR family transcriptional regulator, transcriptional repressor for nem operon